MTGTEVMVEGRSVRFDLYKQGTTIKYIMKNVGPFTHEDLATALTRGINREYSRHVREGQQAKICPGYMLRQ